MGGFDLLSRFPRVGYDMLRFIPPCFFLSFFSFSVLFPLGRGQKKTTKKFEMWHFWQNKPALSPVSIPNCFLYLLDDAVFTAFVLLSFFAYLFTVADWLQIEDGMTRAPSCLAPPTPKSIRQHFLLREFRISGTEGTLLWLGAVLVLLFCCFCCVHVTGVIL